MSTQDTDGQQGTAGATALHLVATFILFVVLNFGIGLLWTAVIRPPSATPSVNFMDFLYGALTYGVALWLALVVPHRFIPRSRAGIVAVVCGAVSVVIMLIRLWAILSIISAFAGDQEMLNFAWLSAAVIVFQAICSFVAIWLFYRQASARGAAT